MIMALSEIESKPFQFITRTDPTAPLINRGSLAYCVRRMTKKLKTMRLQTKDEIKQFKKIEIIRDELRKLKNEL
jgi:hypothetical protein